MVKNIEEHILIDVGLPFKELERLMKDFKKSKAKKKYLVKIAVTNL